ncbi:MAG: glycosyltransferase family 4 protein [Myxococcaceae bacterium]
MISPRTIMTSIGMPSLGLTSSTRPSARAGFEPTRILFLNPVGVVGGAERLLLDLIASLRSCAPQVDLSLICATEGPLLAEAKAMGVSTSLVRMPDALATLGDSGMQEEGQLSALMRMLSGVGREGAAAASYMGDLREAMAAQSPALIHSNGIKTHLLASLVVPSTSPVVWHIHDFLGERRLMRRVLRLLRRRASLAIANSEAVGVDIERTLPSLPMRVVRNGVDTACFRPGEEDGAQLDGLAGMPAAPPGTIRVGLVATFARWKGQDVFLRAAGRVLAKEPSTPVRFYIVGGPIYRTTDSQFEQSELVRLANELGLQGRVGFIGFQREVAPIYRALDVVVHASVRAEPFGLTIAEAMACGKSVLVSAAGGAAELFEHGVDAMGFTPGSFVELSEALATLIAQAPLRFSLGARAREHALAKFGRSRLGPEVLRAYQAIA